MLPDMPPSDLGRTGLDGDNERWQLPGRGVSALKKCRDATGQEDKPLCKQSRNFDLPWPRKEANICVPMCEVEGGMHRDA